MKKFLKRAAFPPVFSSALVCVGCGSSSAAPPSTLSDNSGGTYAFCYTTSPSHGITLSSVFRLPAADQVTMLEEPWAKDFRRFVGEC